MIKKSYNHIPVENSYEEIINLLKIALSKNATIDLEINSIVAIGVDDRKSTFTLIIQSETNYDDYFG